ncbi:hypothetical protein KGP17_05560 [Serratia sp. JSRIV001]|uniref:hypothetical protein n=1 Tax=unclassified Serratia (in: enterobacteria) TaxID=2647522 RepID=UPI001CC07A13|nr:MULTISPECIES: hypothetical protein [unclassified Serratia (in: enterobacteria)]UAN47011.1 hypothetical protein KGP17_05560 [Serratia sp. JSRIV001]UAN55452.1 hypothetical protein KGP21_17295 [Serratia sp. JSRIV004]UAN57265.1 hypothetical protein KGP21_27320 [Serratia sp. JSRIV004]
MDRNTWRKDGLRIALKVASGVKIYGGHMVAINEEGFAVPADRGSDTDNLAVSGVSDEFVDNTGGADGDVIVLIRRGGAFCLANSASKPVTQALVGRRCQVQDSVTVAVDATSKRTAGTVIEVSPDGVWVYIS